jgi:hypothetical protein
MSESGLLRRIDPNRNMARFHTMSVQPTLFGDWALGAPAGSCHAASPPSRELLWPWRNISRQSSVEAIAS